MRTSLNKPKVEKCSCGWLLSYFQDSYAVALTSKFDFEKAVPPFGVVEFQHTDDVL
jgi:hypothetical protein